MERITRKEKQIDKSVQKKKHPGGDDDLQYGGIWTNSERKSYKKVNKGKERAHVLSMTHDTFYASFSGKEPHDASVCFTCERACLQMFLIEYCSHPICKICHAKKTLKKSKNLCSPFCDKPLEDKKSGAKVPKDMTKVQHMNFNQGANMKVVCDRCFVYLDKKKIKKHACF